MGAFRTCDGLTRRDFLRLGTLGVAGLTLPDFFELRAAAAAAGGAAPRAKAAIVLWMAGGPSHIDTFDPKPEAPAEWRGEFGALSTPAGFQVTEHLPKLAAMAPHYSVLRAMTHPEGAHERGATYMLTGYRVVPGFDYPGYGSVVARETGWKGSMPPYVAVPGVIGDAGPGYLGADGSPFSSGDPGGGNYQVADINLPGNVPVDRLARRREFLAAADAIARTGQATDPVASTDRFYERAYELVTSAEVKRAFDLSAEPPALRDRYGRNSLGQGALLARRLIESGVRFVTVSRGGWDNHGGIFGALRSQRLPELDAAFSTLLADLKDRGMLDEVLVVWMGEFGRTPRLNMTGGRDHWPKVSSVVLAGGGLRGGLAVGQSDGKAEEPRERPTRPEDVAFTLFHALGINPARVFHTPSGRPIRIANDGQVIRELL